MKKIFVTAAALVAVAGGAFWWTTTDTPPFLTEDTAAFVGTFSAPPMPDSAQTRQELAALLELQRTRSPAEVAAAQADSHKHVEAFYAALGLDPTAAPPLPALRSLTDEVEKEVGHYVNTAKRHFRRARPHVVEPRLEPCIGHVRDDESYPSGHAAYGYVIAYLLGEMVPERRAALARRADEFARQRMVCGVHFPSDIEAGKRAAEWLTRALLADPEYAARAQLAAHELRAALHLQAGAPAR